MQESIATLNWVAERALGSGVLAEQVNPFTGEPVSVSPLTWSHAGFIIAVQRYLKKFLELESCPSCGQPLSLKMLGMHDHGGELNGPGDREEVL